MSAQQKDKFKLSLSLISILAIYMFSGLGNFMSSVITVFAEHWSDVDITMIRFVSTIPALVSMVSMLAVAGLVGKVRFRTISIISLALALVGGVGPLIFAPSWTVVLAYRVLLGIGVGGLGCRSALLMKSVPVEYRTKYIGIATAIQSLFGVIAGPATGWLANFGWNMPFAINGLAIIGLLLVVFFLHEPDEEPEEAAAGQVKEAAAAGSGAKEKLPAKVIFFVLLHMVLVGVKYPLLTGMATLFDVHQIGSPVLVGTVLSTYTLGCMASAFIDPVRKVFGKYTMAVGYGMAIVGLGMVLLHPTLFTCIAGCIISGAGFMWAFSLLQIYNADVCTPATLGLASTLMLVGNQVGVFISNYFILLFDSIFHLQTDIESAILGAIICFVVAVILCLVPGLVVPKKENIKI